MKQIKEKIDKLPLIIRSIIYGMIASTCIICSIIFLLSIIYLFSKFVIKPLSAMLNPIVSIFIAIWILMTLVISITVFIESRR